VEWIIDADSNVTQPPAVWVDWLLINWAGIGLRVVHDGESGLPFPERQKVDPVAQLRRACWFPQQRSQKAPTERRWRDALLPGMQRHA
jgi:hypothetical protein